MKSKQRVMACLNGDKYDRVPFNYHFLNGEFDKKIKKHFGLELHDDEGLRLALNIDFRRINPVFKGDSPHKDFEGRKVAPDFGIRFKWVQNESGGYWEPCDPPLANCSLEQAQQWWMPSPDDYDYDMIDGLCKEYKEYCIIIGTRGVGDCINNTGFLCGMENVLIGMATDDPAIFEVMDRRRNLELEMMRRTLEAGKGRIDMLLLGEDLGSQRGPLISHQMYETVIKPRHKEFTDLAKEYNVKVMMHSDGAVSDFYEDFIDVGIHVHDAVQIECEGMDPKRVKDGWGDRIAFHGAIPVTGNLCFGSVDDIRKEVQEILEIMSKGGGYILSPSHDVQDNTPVENFLAMYETAANY